MTLNMGPVDRKIRLGVAVVAAVLAVVAGLTSVLGIILLVVAVIMLATSLVGFCPLYAPFTFSTARRPAVRR